MSTANTVRSFSDHNMISMIIRTRDRKEQCQEALRRDRSKMNVERYLMKIKNIDWKELFDSTDINIINPQQGECGRICLYFTVLYCTVLYYTVLYCTLIVFSPNTIPLTTTKYQVPQTCISSSDLYFKIRGLLCSLLIYRNFPAVWRS